VENGLYSGTGNLDNRRESFPRLLRGFQVIQKDLKPGRGNSHFAFLGWVLKGLAISESIQLLLEQVRFTPLPGIENRGVGERSGGIDQRLPENRLSI